MEWSPLGQLVWELCSDGIEWFMPGQADICLYMYVVLHLETGTALGSI